MFGDNYFYVPQSTFDMCSATPWNSMNLQMNQAWEDMVARQHLYDVPLYSFNNFNQYYSPFSSNPFNQILDLSLRQADWQNKRAGGNGFLDANGNFSYKPNFSWAGFTPSGSNNGGASGVTGPNAETETDRDYRRKYNTLLAVVKQLINSDELTRKEKDDLSAVSRQTVKNWKDDYKKLKDAYDKIDKETVEKVLVNTTELSAIDENLDADKSDSFKNQLIASGYEYNSDIDNQINDLYDAISKLSDEDGNPESAHILGELQKGEDSVNILDIISSYNSAKQGSSVSTDRRIIDHIAANYNKMTDADSKDTAKEKVLKPIVNALCAKARKVKDNLDETSRKAIEKAITNVEDALNRSKDKVDSSLSNAFDTLYLLTRMGAMANLRNSVIEYYGEVDSEVFNQELFMDKTIADLKQEGFTETQIKDCDVKPKKEAVVEERENVDDVEDTDDEEEIKPNKKLDKETVDKQIETLIANDVIQQTSTKYSIEDEEGNSTEYEVYETIKGEQKRLFIVKDNKIVELKNAEIKDGKVVAKTAGVEISEVEVKASDIEVAHKEAVKAEQKAEKERKAEEAKAEKERKAAEEKAKETVNALVEADILTPYEIKYKDGRTEKGYKETRATGDRTEARLVRIEGSEVQVYDAKTKSWVKVDEPKASFEKDFKVMTEEEIKEAKEIGDEIKWLIDGYTDDDDWAGVKSNVGKINERNVLYVIKAFNDTALYISELYPDEDFFTHCQSEYQDEKVDKLTKPVLEYVIEFIDDNLDSLDATDRQKVLKIKENLQTALNELTVDTKGNYIDKQINSLIEIFQIK